MTLQQRVFCISGEIIISIHVFLKPGSHVRFLAPGGLMQGELYTVYMLGHAVDKFTRMLNFGCVYTMIALSESFCG